MGIPHPKPSPACGEGVIRRAAALLLAAKTTETIRSGQSRQGSPLSTFAKLSAGPNPLRWGEGTINCEETSSHGFIG